MNTPHDRSTGHDGGSGDRAPGYRAADASGADQDATEQLKSEGTERLDQYRDVAADKLDTLADSVKAAASQLEGDDVGHLSGHIADMADSMSQLSDGLRNKSVDEILHDVRRVARDNPTLFLAGSIALGFGLTRFARASAPTSGRNSNDKRSSADSGSGQQRASDRSSTGSHRSGADRAASQGQRPSTGARGSHDTSSAIAGTVEHPVSSASRGTSGEAQAADTRGGLAGNARLAGGSGPDTINDASLGTAASGSTRAGPHDAGGGSAAALGTRTATPGAAHQAGSTYETGADQSNGRKPS